MNKKIYIAGKVTGLDPIEVAEKFSNLEKTLIKSGYDVINPLRIVQSAGLYNASWQVIMRHCIAALVHCDEICMLPCWTNSEGAKMEHDTAAKLGMEIHYQIK